MADVFIIGCKGIPAQYGGFETFVEMLTARRVSVDIRYHVACAADELSDQSEYEHNGAHCFCIQWRPIGAARAIAYDLDALEWTVAYIERHAIANPIIYILACRIGPFIGHYARRIHALGGVLLVNPDGHEWMRAKWSAPVRKYWKLSEWGMVRHADLVVCDSKVIERYIHNEYARYDPRTTYIAYGADTCCSALADDAPTWLGWLDEHGLRPDEYYLTVGRFVPENNYETILREFMASRTTKDLALVTNVNDAFLDNLQRRTHYRDDPRVKFVGTEYDRELVKKIRENAFAYIHGHEVGGTNPSLLEALASTKLNLLLDVEFNREVASDSAFYWNKVNGSLSKIISVAEAQAYNDRLSLAEKSSRIIQLTYSWDDIVSQYECLFHALN